MRDEASKKTDETVCKEHGLARVDRKYQAYRTIDPFQLLNLLQETSYDVNFKLFVLDLKTAYQANRLKDQPWQFGISAFSKVLKDKAHQLT